jgi:hypothetical protein
VLLQHDVVGEVVGVGVGALDRGGAVQGHGEDELMCLAAEAVVKSLRELTAISLDPPARGVVPRERLQVVVVGAVRGVDLVPGRLALAGISPRKGRKPPEPAFVTASNGLCGGGPAGVSGSFGGSDFAFGFREDRLDFFCLDTAR